MDGARGDDLRPLPERHRRVRDDDDASTKAAANDCFTAPVANVKLNEVESSGGSPGDWVELRNNGATTADVGGYRFIDNDATHTPYAIPAGTTLAPGAYYVLEEAAFGFGLGAADSATLFAPDGATVDTHAWTAHAATTFGRCPDGTGSFLTTQAPTKGAANLCAGDIPASPWPGGAAVTFADDAGVFGGNISGLAYQASGTDAPGVLWVVKNGPGTMYRLLWDGTKWTPDTANGWGAGKILRYTDGTGDPDAEGVTLIGDDPANGVYVSTERNNAVSGVSRPAVLRFDVSQPGTTLVATADWNLTERPSGLGANLGLEAVEWMSDSFLVSKGFTDEARNAPYDPAAYPGHGTGLFFVGVEQDGVVYAYALDQTTSAFTRVATIVSGFPGVMELEFEPETSHLWAVCDDTCQGRSATLDIVQGKFVVTNVFERPAGMPNRNNEGFAIAPQDECVDGHKPVFWTDDGNIDNHAIRGGTINCTVIVRDQTITFAQPAAMTFGGAPVPLVATASSGLPVSFTAAGPCAITGSRRSPPPAPARAPSPPPSPATRATAPPTRSPARSRSRRPRRCSTRPRSRSSRLCSRVASRTAPC